MTMDSERVRQVWPLHAKPCVQTGCACLPRKVLERTRVANLALAAVLLLAGLPVYGQTELDVEPPTVELEQIESGEAGARQDFTARVVDDRRITEVLLYYRFAGEETFENIPMRAVGSSSNYSASVPTGIGDTRDIEYYIQARDEAGNRVIKGYAFSPLVRSMGRGDTPPGPAAEGPRIRKAWLYAGLGVLATGAVIALLNADDGNGDSLGPNEFRLTVDVPEGIE